MCDLDVGIQCVNNIIRNGLPKASEFIELVKNRIIILKTMVLCELDKNIECSVKIDTFLEVRASAAASATEITVIKAIAVNRGYLWST